MGANVWRALCNRLWQECISPACTPIRRRCVMTKKKGDFPGTQSVEGKAAISSRTL